MKPIVITPNEVLIKPASPVEKIDAKILSLIKDMQDTLIMADNPKGVGLAAPQIGISLRIFLMRPEETDPIRVFINPRYMFKSKRIVHGIPGSENRLEGCLSIPHVWGNVKRHQSITLSFMNENDRPQEEKFSGFEAVIIQHEMDHLDGILFPRRVIEQKGRLYKPGVDDEGKEVLEPLEI